MIFHDQGYEKVETNTLKNLIQECGPIEKAVLCFNDDFIENIVSSGDRNILNIKNIICGRFEFLTESFGAGNKKQIISCNNGVCFFNSDTTFRDSKKQEDRIYKPNKEQDFVKRMFINRFNQRGADFRKKDVSIDIQYHSNQGEEYPTYEFYDDIKVTNALSLEYPDHINALLEERGRH